MMISWRKNTQTALPLPRQFIDTPSSKTPLIFFELRSVGTQTEERENYVIEIYIAVFDKLKPPQ